MPLRLKSALFVDFDNIFIGLKQDNLRAAEEFGHNVRRWLTWIETKMAVLKDENGNDGVRDILVRRCYGNPETFAPYRAWFTRSGFSVVDCPALTASGKNSADIVMVMDVLDVLNHPTRFDEFIIMSADADFTPLLLRLRMHDRRTVAIVAGNAAAAYKASCDLVVPDDVFVDDALQVRAAQPPMRPPMRPAPYAPKASPELLDAIAARVYEEASASGEVAASRLPAIFREFKEFTATSRWLGFHTLRGLTEALVARRPELRMTEEEEWDVVVDVPAAAPAQPGRRELAPAPAQANGGAAELRGQIVEVVRGVVAEAREPVMMARVAHAVIKALGPVVLESQWAGAGTFKHLLEQVDDLGLTMVPYPQPGYIYDPERHDPPSQEPAEVRPENLAGLPERLSGFIRRIAEVTGAPRLNPAQYAVLFEVTAKEVEKAPYDLTWTSKAVRDQLLERGENISRLYVSFVLRGIGFSGYQYRRAGIEEAPQVARAFHGNVIKLLRGAQVVLTDEELRLLDEWLLSTPDHAGESASSGDEPATGDEASAPAASIPAFAANGNDPGSIFSSAEPAVGSAPAAPTDWASSADSVSTEATWERPEGAGDPSPAAGRESSEADGTPSPNADWESSETPSADAGWQSSTTDDPSGDARGESSVLDEIAAGSARWEPAVSDEIRSGAQEWEPLAVEDADAGGDGSLREDVRTSAGEEAVEAESVKAPAEPIIAESGRSWFSKWLRPDEEEAPPASVAAEAPDERDSVAVDAAADDERGPSGILGWDAPTEDESERIGVSDDSKPPHADAASPEPTFDAADRWEQRFAAPADEPRAHAADSIWATEEPAPDLDRESEEPVVTDEQTEIHGSDSAGDTDATSITNLDDAQEEPVDADDGADDLPWLSYELPADQLSPEPAEPAAADEAPAAATTPVAEAGAEEVDGDAPAPPSWLFPPFPAGGRGQ